MHVSELRQLTDKKLRTRLREARRELAVSRFHVQTGQNQDASQIQKLRKLIAQIMTLLTERTLLAQTPTK